MCFHNTNGGPMLKNRHQLSIDCATCSVRHLCLAQNQESTSIAELNELIQKVRCVKKGEHIFHAFDPAYHIYAIFTGSCKEYQLDENGNECVKNFYFPGDIIGLESIPDQKHLFAATALEDTQLCAIPLEPLLELISKNAQLLKRFIDINSYKMQNDQQVRVSTNASQRVADFLENMVLRIQQRNITQNEVVLPMSQIDISNFLGMAHETVNRILRQWHLQNIIRYKNKRISHINMERLHFLSGGFKFQVQHDD